MKRAAVIVLLALAGAVLAACGSTSADRPTAPAAAQEQRFPDVLEVKVSRAGETYSFEVTISSPYDTPQRYADGWQVKDAEGKVYGEHTLAHDHAGEQPFTRTQTGVRIPPEVDQVIVEARDSRFGYGGATRMVQP